MMPLLKTKNRMKKIIILSICLIIGFSQAQAQKLSGGIKGGLNLSNLSGDTNDALSETDSRLGFHAGFFLNYQIIEKWSLQPELTYSQKGRTASLFIQTFNKTAEFKQEASYLDFPVLLNFSPTENFFISVGPQLSILISDDFNDFDRGFRVAPKKQDFSAIFRLGYSLNKVNLSLSYQLGLSESVEPIILDGTNNVDAIKSSPLYNNDFKNSVLQLSVSYRLFGE
jgi:hypothetical protein